VDDAFAPCIASTPAFMTSRSGLPAYAGDLVQRELEVLRKLTGEPARPFRRGARRLETVGQARRDRQPAAQGRSLLIGGGMGYTFLKAKGYEVGKSPAARGCIGARSPT